MSEVEALGAGARPTAWVDGRLVAADQPALVVGDRAFQLGDGLFETLRVRRGVAIERDLHLARLREGMGVLAIPMPWSDADLAAAITEVVRANAPDDAAVRITVSRGAPLGRGLLPAGWRQLRPTVVLQAWPHVPLAAEVLARGARAVIASGRRDPAFPLASVKTTSRADHVHAKLEAELAGADDAITLTLNGHVAEATTANVAIIIGERVLTPPLGAGILAGNHAGLASSRGGRRLRGARRRRGLVHAGGSSGGRRGSPLLLGRGLPAARLARRRPDRRRRPRPVGRAPARRARGLDRRGVRRVGRGRRKGSVRAPQVRAWPPPRPANARTLHA